MDHADGTALRGPCPEFGHRLQQGDDLCRRGLAGFDPDGEFWGCAARVGQARFGAPAVHIFYGHFIECHPGSGGDKGQIIIWSGARDLHLGRFGTMGTVASGTGGSGSRRNQHGLRRGDQTGRAGFDGFGEGGRERRDRAWARGNGRIEKIDDSARFCHTGDDRDGQFPCIIHGIQRSTDDILNRYVVVMVPWSLRSKGQIVALARHAQDRLGSDRRLARIECGCRSNGQRLADHSTRFRFSRGGRERRGPGRMRGLFRIQEVDDIARFCHTGNDRDGQFPCVIDRIQRDAVDIRNRYIVVGGPCRSRRKGQVVVLTGCEQGRMGLDSCRARGARGCPHGIDQPITFGGSGSELGGPAGQLGDDISRCGHTWNNRDG